MAVFTGTPQAFLGNVMAGAIDAVSADIGPASTTYTPRAASDPKLALLVCDGNSLPFGSGVPAGSEFTLNYPFVCQALLRVSQNAHASHVWKIVNKGTGSLQTPAMTARFPTLVQPLFNAGYRKKIVQPQEYINHRRAGGASHATAQQAYLDYIAQAQAGGWEVLLSTIPPTGPADIFFPGVGLDTSAINTFLRANFASLSPYPLVDVVAAGLSNPTDLALWNADQVHPNTAGYQLFAQTLHDIVAAIL